VRQGNQIKISMQRITLAAMMGCLALSAGCRSHEINSTNPFERAAAAVDLAEQQAALPAGQRDLTAIHKLVTLLEDRDPGVRLYSATALERLCGKRYGYRYYDPPEQREAAVERWRKALEDQEVTLVAQTSIHHDQTQADISNPPSDSSTVEAAGF
jgi:hypothetical protein